MKTLTLHDGTQMPAFGLGTWKSKPDEVYQAVRTAIEVGYRHIDCAAVYQNETDVGRALSDAFAAGDVTREELWVTSKLWNDAHAQDEVQAALTESLRKLQLDRLDLYLMHWPIVLQPGVYLPRSASDFRPLSDVPLETTWAAMLETAERGLARQVGVSNFTASKIKKVSEAVGVTPAMNQVELHPYLQQPKLLAACASMGVALTAYSPLGSPDSATMFGREDGVRLTEHPTIQEVASRRGATPGQVLIAWGLDRGTAVIPKSVNPSRIKENLGAEDVVLDDEDRTAIAALNADRRMLDASFWFVGDDYDAESFWAE